MRAQRVAVSAAIVHGGALLWSGATGTANRAWDVAASDNSVYPIASISKTVTAAAVIQLVEDGFLELDEDINIYLPFTFRNPHQPSAVVAFDPQTNIGTIIFTNGSVSSDADWNALTAFFLALIREGSRSAKR